MADLTLFAERAAFVKARYQECGELFREGMQGAIQVGQALIEMQRVCPYGEWERRCGVLIPEIPQRTIRAMIRFASRWPQLESEGLKLEDVTWRMIEGRTESRTLRNDYETGGAPPMCLELPDNQRNVNLGYVPTNDSSDQKGAENNMPPATQLDPPFSLPKWHADAARHASIVSHMDQAGAALAALENTGLTTDTHRALAAALKHVRSSVKFAAPVACPGEHGPDCQCAGRGWITLMDSQHQSA